jgi:hypothetical protein
MGYHVVRLSRTWMDRSAPSGRACTDDSVVRHIRYLVENVELKPKLNKVYGLFPWRLARWLTMLANVVISISYSCLNRISQHCT